MNKKINELKKYKDIYEGINIDFIDDEYIHVSKNKDRLYFSNPGKQVIIKKEILELFKKIFNLEDDKEFDKHFDIVVTGQGKEINKISNLRSSSLCSLLNFYKVSEDNPIIIDDTKYTKVSFEVKNPVINSPSSIDLVLESEDKVLYLESKFSEYYSKESLNYSDKYIKYWENIKDFFDKYTTVKSSKEGYVRLIKRQKPNCYTEGIKQMISHYIGVINFINNGEDKDTRIKLGNRKVELATILFDNDKWSKDEFNFYKEDYEELISMLKAEKTKENFANIICDGDKSEKEALIKKLNDKLNIRDTILTYQKDIFDKNPNYFKNISDNIKKYYGYKD